MRFQRTLYFLTYATSLWAFLMLMGFGQLPVVSVVLYLTAFVLCLINDRRPLGLPEKAWLPASLLALGLALYGWFGLRIYFDSVVNLFLFLQINRLWTARSHRDVLQIYGLTFFQVLAAAVSTASVLFAPALAVYLFLMLGALITLTIKRDAELAFLRRRDARKGEQLGVRRLNEGGMRRLSSLHRMPWLDQRLMKRLGLALTFIVVIGMSLFYIIPRLQGQALSLGITGHQGASLSSGFTDSVNFIGMGEIQTDPTIVMRILPAKGFELYGDYPTLDLMRLRGTSLDLYDGRSWTKSEAAQRRMRTTDRRRTIEFNQDPATLSPADVYSVRIQMEPNRKGFIFGPDRPYQFLFDEDVVLLLDPLNSSLQVLNLKWNGPLTYTVETREPMQGWDSPEQQAEMNKRFKAALETESENQTPPIAGGFRQERRREWNDRFNQLYLQLPEIEDITAVRTLATEWTQGIEGPVDKARRIEHRLRNYYSYSLDVSFSQREDHLAYFLTEKKAGHCEYFATAMALMLRTQGIPARVVNGYASDEWIAGGTGYYLVRQEHAHSWVEAWFPGAGWRTFDPTPAAGIGGQRLPNTFYRKLTRWYDMVKFHWYEQVIDYDAQDQTHIFVGIIRALRRGSRMGEMMQHSFLDGIRGPAGQAGFGVVLLVLAIITGAGAWLMRKRSGRKARRKASAETEQALTGRYVQDYRELLARLESEHERPDSMTAREYARRIAAEKGQLVDFVELTEVYYDARFNGGVWTDREGARAKALLRLLESRTEAPANREQP